MHDGVRVSKVQALGNARVGAALAGCGALLALTAAGGASACSGPVTGLAARDGGGNDADTADASSSDDDAGDVGGPSEAEANAFASLVTYAQQRLAAKKTPGASLAVVLHGKLAFASGVGDKTVGGDPVGTSTLFRVGSMSKMILAAAAMSLVDQHALDLHAPITQYLPWFKLHDGFDASGVTTDLLLSHTSGFPGDTIGICDSQTSGARLDFFENNPQPLWSPPGAVWDYSNAGYSLASLVVTAAAGKTDADYEALVHDRVFAPLGMATATFDAAAASSADHALGYELDPAGNVLGTVEPTRFDCPMMHAPGGINATATDYAHFAEMLLANGGSLLSPASVAAMEASHANPRDFPGDGYGYALFSKTAEYADHVVFDHPGAVPGFTSEIVLVPDLGFAAVVLLNGLGDGAPYDEIAQYALGAFIPEKQSHPTRTTPSSTWSAYSGTYDDAWGKYGKGITVSTADGGAPGLVFDAPNASDGFGASAPLHGAMQQYATDSWILPDGTEATFFPNDAGAPTYLATRVGTGIRR